MATTLTRKLERLEEAIRRRPAGAAPLLRRLRRDPSRILTEAGLTPDCWQQDLLRSSHPRVQMLCSRQAGKSLTAAALALKAALLEAPALVLLLSPSLRQSGELFQAKVLSLFNALGRPVAPVRESALQFELANGSRVVSLPGDSEATVRGYSNVRLLVIDEASRVDDGLYFSVRPMLAVSGGQLVALSTPYGRRGWYWKEWSEGREWQKVCITAADCPRISKQFLAEEERSMGPRWFAQEYRCSFESAVDSVFAYEEIQAMLTPNLRPLFSLAG
jgi:hypothetical protein